MRKASEILGKVCHSCACLQPTILVDHEIAALALGMGMIEPFVNRKVSRIVLGERILSYGLEPCGYSACLGYDFKMEAASLQLKDQTLDPKHPPKDEDYNRIYVKGSLIVEAHSMISGVTIERFHLPPDVQGLCIGKSSYTRLGLLTQFTGIEPGFEGNITVQLINVSDQAIRVYPGEGILQVLFWLSALPDSTYAGVYQGQTGVVTGRGQ